MRVNNKHFFLQENDPDNSHNKENSKRNTSLTANAYRESTFFRTQPAFEPFSV